jgi:hypothetical protein
MAARYAFACGGRRRRTGSLSSADGKAKPPKADREREAERRRTAAALRMTVEDAAVALAANQRPHYAFEQELAGHARGLIWLDLTKAFLIQPLARAARDGAIPCAAYFGVAARRSVGIASR